MNEGQYDLSIAIFAAAFLTAVVTRKSEDKQADVQPVQVAPPQSPPPKCIHEVCGERPAWLTGVGYAGYGGYERYRIDYEHHCQCDSWAPTDEPRPVEKPRD